MNRDFLIVSVESRKGGVGKTTAALNLARILLEKRKHAVLFLDVDITGTNATDCIDSPFWKDTCHAVRHVTKGDAPVANLLAIFEQQFMPGLSRPKFVKDNASNDQASHGSLVLAADRINVLGSQIYDLTDSSGEAGDTCICKPSILFDELHAFWFIEFLQRICQAFLLAIRKDEPERTVAVIVDNSPGYVGIAPAVQEWLTDLGPDRGKFLTVASLDTQDLLSCGHAIHNLHRLYTRKWETSRKFADAMTHKTAAGKEIQLARDEESFFLRLVETQPQHHESQRASWRASNVSGEGLSFYRRDDSERSEGYLNQPEKYQGLVINRVPRLVKRGVYTYDTERMYSLLHRKGSDVMQHLLGADRSSYAHWMVSYDESIEYQFLQPMISRRFARVSRRKGRFEDFMHAIQERHIVPADEPLQKILHEARGFDPMVLEEAGAYLRNVHEAVTAVIRLVEQSGFSHLMHLIHEEWLPGSILRDLRIAMQDVLLEMDAPFVEFMPGESGEDRIGPEAWMFAEQLWHYTERHMEDSANMPDQVTSAERFLPSLVVVVALSLGPVRLHPEPHPELLDLFGSIAAIEASHWRERRGRSKERLSIQRFLAGESLGEREWREFPQKLRIRARWLERGLFARLYRACAAAQARVFDVRQDALFLVALIQRLVMEDIHEAPVLPYVRAIAEKVIVRKTMSHESGEEQIAKGFSSVQYMEEFSEVLERILAKWEGDE